ncbi:MAG: hypothetical protein WCF65_06865 [Parachlamydiaceae bacterium]
MHMQVLPFHPTGLDPTSFQPPTQFPGFEDQPQYPLPDSDDPEVVFNAAEAELLTHLFIVSENQKQLVKVVFNDAMLRLKTEFAQKALSQVDRKDLIRKEVRAIRSEIELLKNQSVVNCSLRERVKDLPYARDLIHAIQYRLAPVPAPQSTVTQAIRGAYACLGVAAEYLNPVNQFADSVVDGVVMGANWAVDRAVKPVVTHVSENLGDMVMWQKVHYTIVSGAIAQAREKNHELNAVLGSVENIAASIAASVVESSQPIVKSVKYDIQEKTDRIKAIFQTGAVVLDHVVSQIPGAIETTFDIPAVQTRKAASDALDTTLGVFNIAIVGAVGKAAVGTTIPLVKRGISAFTTALGAVDAEGGMRILSRSAAIPWNVKDVTPKGFKTNPLFVSYSSPDLGPAMAKPAVGPIVPAPKAIHAFDRMMVKMPDLGAYDTIKSAIAAHVHEFHNAAPIIKDPFNYVRGLYPQLRRAMPDVLLHDQAVHITKFVTPNQTYHLTVYKSSLDAVANGIGLGILRSFKLTGIVIPELLAVGRVSEGALKGSFALESCSPGSSVGQMMRETAELPLGSPQRDSMMADLIAFSSKFGEGLAEINSKHVGDRFPLKPETIGNLYTEAMETITTLNQSGFAIDVLEAESAVEQLCRGAIRNPGGSVCGIEIHPEQFHWNEGQIHLRNAARVPATLSAVVASPEVSYFVPLTAATAQFHGALDLFRREGVAVGLSTGEVTALSSAFSSKYEGFFESTGLKPLTPEGRQFFEVNSLIQEIKRQHQFMSTSGDHEVARLTGQLIQELRTIRPVSIQKIHNEIDSIAKGSTQPKFPLRDRLNRLFDLVDDTVLSDDELLKFINKYFETLCDNTDVRARKAFTRRYLS